VQSCNGPFYGFGAIVRVAASEHRVPVIGELLRHRHPNTTTIYAKVDLPALHKLALAWPGGDR
jgi:hypothetical protein